MLNKIYNFLKPGLFPFSIAFLLLILNILYAPLGLPSASAVSEYFIEQYKNYGLIIIIVAAFLEGLFMLSIYLPGSLVIILSAFALGFDILTLLKIGILSILGFTLVNIVNYFLGKYGYYKFLLKLGGNDSINRIESDFKENSFRTIFFTAFHPNFLAITMISAGIAGSNLIKTLLQSIISLTFWIVIWMTIITLFFRHSKVSFTENENQGYYFLLIFIIWGLIKCFFGYKKRK